MTLKLKQDYRPDILWQTLCSFCDLCVQTPTYCEKESLFSSCFSLHLVSFSWKLNCTLRFILRNRQQGIQKQFKVLLSQKQEGITATREAPCQSVISVVVAPPFLLLTPTLRAGEMAELPSALLLQLEDQSLDPSTHISRFTSPCNSSYQRTGAVVPVRA